MEVMTVNVSALAPPEPMQVILSSLAQLPSGTVLKVIHRREPFPLYERLLAHGWLYHSKQVLDESYIIYIAKGPDKQQFNAFIAANA